MPHKGCLGGRTVGSGKMSSAARIVALRKSFRPFTHSFISGPFWVP